MANHLGHSGIVLLFAFTSIIVGVVSFAAMRKIFNLTLTGHIVAGFVFTGVMGIQMILMSPLSAIGFFRAVFYAIFAYSLIAGMMLWNRVLCGPLNTSKNPERSV